MRPRVFPAEDPSSFGLPDRKDRRFNEAAGIPRGRHHQEEPTNAHPLASMRPRVFPAEDSGSAVGDDPWTTASMRPRVFPAEDSFYAYLYR